MLHPTDCLSVPPTFQAAAEDTYAALQKDIARSQGAISRRIALAIGFGYVAAIACTAAMIRLFGAGKPDRLDLELARTYFYVPEMALHKSIELRAFIAAGITGAVADLGCGNGIIGSMLMRHSAIRSLHGIDMEPASGTAALANGYSAFLASDVSKIDAPGGSFDAVISICVLEHVRDLAAALREARRLLRPKGRLFFSTPSPTFHEGLIGYRLRRMLGLGGAAAAYARKRDLQSMHMHFLGAEAWTQILRYVGFERIEVQPIFSRRQLLLYDLMNLGIRFPRLYFCDKVQSYGSRHPWFVRLATWAAAVLTAWASAGAPTGEAATHWFISATAAAELP